MPDPIITKEVRRKLEQSIVERLIGEDSPLPDFVSEVISKSLNLPDIIQKVRERIPNPSDGKDAKITDEMISGIVIQVLEKVQEINQVKDGIDGRDGKDGDQGLQGIAGRDGQPGRNGIDGRAGLNGQAGQRGPEGPRGEPGKQGVRGLTGKDGANGQDGKPGINGINGKDYAITEEEFQAVVDRIDFDRFVPREEVAKQIKKLTRDITNGKIELPAQQTSGGGGLTGSQLVAEINKVLKQESWQDSPISVINTIGEAYIIGNDTTNDSQRLAISPVNSFISAEKRVAGSFIPTPIQAAAFQIDPALVIRAYKAGQISYDPNSLVHLMDTGVNGVRIQVGQEEYFLVYNDTIAVIPNGKACYASGVNVPNGVLTVGLADNSSFVTSAQTLGLATHNIGINELGLVTWRGIVRDFDTTGTGFGLTYLGTAGNITNVKPLYPNNRIAMGALIKSGVSDGQFQVAISSIPRRSASRSYNFTSSDAAAGTHYRAGFYHWGTTSVALNQGSLSTTWGNANVTRAGHIGVVPLAAGIVDTGQVGLQVTGTLDSESGPQVASQTAIITDDITTLTANVMEECIEKFSGLVTISLYVVSGTPTAYSLTFNYGFSKYEDFRNIDGTVTAFNAVWEAGAADTVFNVSLKFHNPIGWTYAATGFIPGNGNICERLTDQAIDSNLIIGEEGAYKRINLLQFINGTAKEGVIIEVVTGSTKSIRSMDLHISAFSEELF